MMDITQKIYDFLLQIPRGKVVSYKIIATTFGVHPRTVASILSKNAQQDVYPCFRVVHADGSIGGYNLGLEQKLRRLMADGVVVRDGKVLKECFWEASIF